MEIELLNAFKRLDNLERVYRAMPGKAAKRAIKFSKDRFRDQTWAGEHGSQPWKRKNLGGRRFRKGNLKRSIRETRRGEGFVAIGTDHPGAKYQNEGAKIPVTPKLRKYFMAKYYEAKEAGKTKEAMYYRNISITKKSFLVIPKSQFIGPSPYLNKIIEREMQADINRALSL